jgi:hypothetical protein
VVFRSLSAFVITDTELKLIAAAAIIAAVVLTACSDMTAPKSACPVTNGSSVCVGK